MISEIKLGVNARRGYLGDPVHVLLGEPEVAVRPRRDALKKDRVPALSTVLETAVRTCTSNYCGLVVEPPLPFAWFN
jgi:hypothetical protein